MGKTLRQASFPRTPIGASFARRLLADALRGWLGEEERLDFAFAIGEAVSNAVRHGGGEQFTVRCSTSDGKITVDVSDDGLGFAPRPLKPPPDGEIGGYGMSIIYQLTDEVHLLDAGRCIRLVKRLQLAPAMPNCAG
jgi:serine/threonine-protein kinase RsbW